MEDEKSQLLEKSGDSPTTTKKSILWSIMVMASCFLSNTFAPGFSYGIIGPMATALARKFHVSVEVTSWLSAVHLAVFLLAAPWMEMLVRAVSIRKIQLIGTLLSALTIALCFLVTRYEHVIIIYGIFTAIGLSLLRATVFAIPVYHFDDELLSFATGLIMLGFTAGIMIFSVPVTEAFVHYGFNMGMLILAPLMSVHLLGVIFFSQDNKNIPIKSLPANRTLKESLRRIVNDSKVLVYIIGGFFHNFGIATLLACIDDFIVKSTSMTLTDASKGIAVYGSMMCVGVIAVVISHALRAKYGKFLLYTVAATTYSVLIISLTQVHSKVQYFSLMAAIGFMYGIQQGNIVAVAQELVGPGEMSLAFAFETFMGGIGVMSGPPFTGFLQEVVGVQYGLYASGGTLLLGAVMLATSAIHSYIKEQKATEQTPYEKDTGF